MKGLATELMRGAVDLHTHSHPEIGLDIVKRVDDRDWAVQAREMGMGALVLKSHLWPTMAAAYHLQHIVPDLPIFGSITLNPTAGGVEPLVVHAAARLGAKVVYMPTWGAAHDLRLGGFSKSMKGWFSDLEKLTPDKGISVVDPDGRLLPKAAATLAAAHVRDLVVFTGHLSPEESIALAEEARRIGFRRLVFAHPHAKGIDATMEQIHRMAELGAFVELCYLSLLPFQRVDPEQIVREIKELGPERCVMTTDYFREWCPAPPEMLRMFVGTLLQLGISAEAIRTMVQSNPRKLLDLEPV